MKFIAVFLLTVFTGLSEAQWNTEPGQWTRAKTGHGSASAAALFRQKQSGSRVSIGGSATASSQTSADGNSTATASANSSATTQASVNATSTGQSVLDTTQAAGSNVTSTGSSVNNSSGNSTETETTTGQSVLNTTQAANGTATTGQSVLNTTQAAGGSVTSTGQSATNSTQSGATTASSVTSGGTTTAASNATTVALVGGGPVQTGVTYPPIVEGGVPPAQVPGVWDALNALRGSPALTNDEIDAILASAVAGVDYPDYAEIPNQINFNCANVHQAGFYADTDFGCQVFRRCDINGIETSYLCPNETVFNQITLICDWFFNVDCNRSAQFADYSNSRLYHSTWVFLDTPSEATTAASVNVTAANVTATTVYYNTTTVYYNSTITYTTAASNSSANSNPTSTTTSSSISAAGAADIARDQIGAGRATIAIEAGNRMKQRQNMYQSGQ